MCYNYNGDSMKKKLKMVLILLIVILVVIISYLTYYKFFKNDNKDLNNINLYKNGISNYEIIKYDESYKDNVMYSLINKIEFYIDKEENIGKLYIDNNKKLHISLNTDVKDLLEELNFNTLYNYSSNNKDFLDAFALAENGVLYHIILVDNDISKIKLDKIDLDTDKIVNFTNLQTKGYFDTNHKSLIVLTSNGNFYDVYTKTYYIKDALYINDKYILYSDMTISDMKGRKFKSDDKDIKVKNIIMLSLADNVFAQHPTEIIITDDNRIMYVSSGEIYVYDKIISNINELENNIIVITFNDKSKIKFTGFYDKELFK